MVGRTPVLVIAGLCILMLGSFLPAADPTVTVTGANVIAEQGRISLLARGSDPDGDSLTYNWTIFSDPTGNAFLGSTAETQLPEVNLDAVRLGLSGGPNFPEPSFEGLTIVLLLKVSDGNATVETQVRVSVSGVNLPPVLRFDTSQMGTAQQPRLTGEGFGVNARDSFDPDGGEVKFLWTITKVLGGGPCDGGMVLFGKETSTPGLPVPKMRATPNQPAVVTLEYIVEDSLNTLRGTLSGYMATPGGCNSTPVVGASASPNPAAFGQTVTLTGTASDPGDTMTYSWVQLGGTTSGIAIANSNQKVATFVAPAETGILEFRFTATDSKGAKASKDVSVQIVEGTGGGGGPTVSCSEEGNQPAEATVPSRVSAISGNRVSVEATNGRDPDNTSVFVNGVLLTGVSYRWEVAAGAGILTDNDLENAHTQRVSFDTPQLSSDKTLLLNVVVNDPAACGTRYAVEVALKASIEPNKPPVAKLSYQIESQGPVASGEGDIPVQAPAVIILDAGASTDEGALQYAFSLVKNLSQGGAELEDVDADTRKLIIAEDTLGQVIAKVTVTDSEGLSDSTELTFQVEDFNAPPEAVVRYRKQGDDTFQTSNGSVVLLASPFTLEIDASESVDDGEFSAAFLVQQSLLFGTAKLKPNGDKSRFLEISIGTQGRVTVVVTVIDDRGQTDVVDLILEISDSRSVPQPVVDVFIGELPLQGGQRAHEGSIITLDASASHLENGDTPNNMSFSWKQIAGDPVNLMLSEGGRIGRFRAPEVEGELANLRFQLELEYLGIKSDPELVEVPVELTPIVYGQVAFGPFGQLTFRTVFVFVNPTRDDLQYRIQFFDGNGVPMEVMLDGEFWDHESYHALTGRDSRRLRFSASDPEVTSIGWAKVTSTRPLRGLVLYQLVDRETEALDSEVSLFSSPLGSRLTSFFDRDYNLAIAIANPGEDQARVLIELIDPGQGPDLPASSRPLILEPGQHLSFYLDESFFPDLPAGFKVGTLVIRAVEGSVAATLLKTNSQGVAISSMPLIAERARLIPDSN